MVSHPDLRLALFYWLLSPMVVYPQQADPTDRIAEAGLAVVIVLLGWGSQYAVLPTQRSLLESQVQTVAGLEKSRRS